MLSSSMLPPPSAGENSPAPVGLGPRRDGLRIGHDDRHQVATKAVSMHERLRHERALGVDVLQLFRRDVFTLRFHQEPILRLEHKKCAEKVLVRHSFSTIKEHY